VNQMVAVLDERPAFSMQKSHARPNFLYRTSRSAQQSRPAA
jgi:hypothetical protein